MGIGPPMRGSPCDVLWVGGGKKEGRDEEGITWKKGAEKKLGKGCTVLMFWGSGSWPDEYNIPLYKRGPRGY